MMNEPEGDTVISTKSSKTTKTTITKTTHPVKTPLHRKRESRVASRKSVKQTSATNIRRTNVPHTWPGKLQGLGDYFTGLFSRSCKSNSVAKLNQESHDRFQNRRRTHENEPIQPIHSEERKRDMDHDLSKRRKLEDISEIINTETNRDESIVLDSDDANKEKNDEFASNYSDHLKIMNQLSSDVFGQASYVIEKQNDTHSDSSKNNEPFVAWNEKSEKETEQKSALSLQENEKNKELEESDAEIDKMGSFVSTCTSTDSVLEKSFLRQSKISKQDNITRMRKTIQWLEESSRQMREDLARVRTELHEERKAANLLRRQLEDNNGECKIKTDLHSSRSSNVSVPSNVVKDFAKDEQYKQELASLRKRLSDSVTTIQKLSQVNSTTKKQFEKMNTMNSELRKLQIENSNLRSINKGLAEKLQIANEGARARAAELRSEHEKHESEKLALRKNLRSDTAKMIDEIQSKSREVERLEKLLSQCTQMNEKLRAKEDETMRKLRESERSHQIRLAPRIEEKIHHDDRVVDLCKVECAEENVELDRLRELAVEQQEVIEVLRQAVKEKERKLDQLSNKRRKEEFYKQWLELEPVAEVEDEEQEEGDSAVSSGPSSLSPQPGAARGPGVTREAYESVLIEVEELQAKLTEEQRELGHARSQVRELEKALLQETRGSQNSRRALSEKLRESEEREAALVSEVCELREQNELLEFRVLELEEAPTARDTPDPADSGVVSPEPIHLYKEQQASKHRDRAVATVIPYSSSYSLVAVATELPQKAPLSLQESGIFEEEDIEGAEEESKAAELSSQGTQTEAPAGELLQEVQRLQELRARIQERAVKPEAPEAAGRLRDLEARIGALEAERRLSKQREEELLDENYRLTDRTFCLEAELKRAMARTSSRREAATMTESQETEPTAEVQRPTRGCVDCGDLWRDCDARIRGLARTEACLRQQIASLEQREGAFFETLRQADATWAKLEADYEAKRREMSERLSAQVELNRALFDHLTKLNEDAPPPPLPTSPPPRLCPEEPMDLEETISTSSSRTSTISRTSIGPHDIDAVATREHATLAEVATEAREEDVVQAREGQRLEGSVISESSSDKKQVIYFRWR